MSAVAARIGRWVWTNRGWIYKATLSKEAWAAGAVKFGAVALIEHELNKRKRDSDDMTRPVKRSRTSGPAIAAGAKEVAQRTKASSYVRTGSRFGKLARESLQFVQRWQRIYNFGANPKAYPSTVTFGTNPNNSSRLCLNHTVTTLTAGAPGQQLMPIYMMDITNWRTDSASPVLGTNYVVPMKRFGWSAASPGNIGAPTWFNVVPQANGDGLAPSYSTWQPEKGPTLNGLPAPGEKKALLDWFYARMAFYGARKHSTNFHLEFVQVKDPAVMFDFHPDGEAFVNMSEEDRDRCRNFWTAECKRLVYHPMDIQMEERDKTLRILKSKSFTIAPDLSNNLDVTPPVHCVEFGGKFNRLVNLNWKTQATDVAPADGEMETAEYEIETAGNLSCYAEPRARIYLMIRCEDFEPVLWDTPLYQPAGSLTSTISSVRTDAGNTGRGLVLDPDGTAGANGLPYSASVPTGTKITGYQAVTLSGNGGAGPGQYSATDGTIVWSPIATADGTSSYAFEDSPSFDIICRTSWTVMA